MVVRCDIVLSLRLCVVFISFIITRIPTFDQISPVVIISHTNQSCPLALSTHVN
jgi:hypothetical protein